MSIPNEICERIRSRFEKSGVNIQDSESVSKFFDTAVDRLDSEISRGDLAFLKNMLSLAAKNDVAEPSIAHKYFPNSDTYFTKANIEKNRVASETIKVPNDSRLGDFKITAPPEMDSYFLIEASVHMTESRFTENGWRNKPIMDEGSLNTELFSSPDMIMHSAINYCIRNEIPFYSESTGLTWDIRKGYEAGRGYAAQTFGSFNEEGKLEVETFQTGFGRDPKGPGLLDIQEMRLSDIMEKRGLTKAVKADIASFDPSKTMSKEGPIMERYRSAMFDKLIGDRLDSLCKEISLNVAPVQVSENKEAYLKKMEETNELENPKNKFKGDNLSM